MNLISLKSFHNLFISSVTLYAAPSINYVYNMILRNLSGKLSDLSLSKDDTSSIREIEIVNSLHCKL